MSLHAKIMNLPALMCSPADSVDAGRAYKIGHRDARHAAADIASEADALIADLVSELKDIRDWAKIGKAPLREQEIKSIEALLSKARSQA
jgi:hypothetical protein